MDVVTPVVEIASPEGRPTARDPERLGRPWGFIDTSKVNADLFIRRLAELVRERHGVGSEIVAKPAPGVPLTDAQADLLAERCGVAIACFGD